MARNRQGIDVVALYSYPSSSGKSLELVKGDILTRLDTLGNG